MKNKNTTYHNFLKKHLVLFFIYCCIINALPLFSQETDFIYTAHRGGAAHAPENSIQAIENALKNNNISRIEIDVRMTKDSVLVLMHDRKINRTTNGKGKVKNMTYEKLKNYKLKHNTGLSKESIPTLDEVFKTINGHKELVIEVKKKRSNAKGIEDKLAEYIKKNDIYNSCIVHSFCDGVLLQLRNIDTNIRLSKLFVYKPAFLPVIIDTRLRFKSLGAYTFAQDFSVNHHFATRHTIKKVHQQNKKLHVWTCNDAQKIEKLKKKGINGVITDVLN